MGRKSPVLCYGFHGVWRGKDGLDWQRERLKLDCRSTTLEPQLECDLAIEDAYDELPIE